MRERGGLSEGLKADGWTKLLSRLKAEWRGRRAKGGFEARSTIRKDRVAHRSRAAYAATHRLYRQGCGPGAPAACRVPSEEGGSEIRSEMASDETSRISGIDYGFRGCSHSLVGPTALWALGLARLQLASVRAGERAEAALAAAPGRVGCGGRRERAARCWPHGQRGCSFRRCVLADERRQLATAPREGLARATAARETLRTVNAQYGAWRAGAGVGAPQ